MSARTGLGHHKETHHKLLLLGGSRGNVPSIRAAKRAGFYTMVADRNSNASGLLVADQEIGIDLIDTDALLIEIEALGGIDGVVAMSEVGVRPAVELATRLGLPSISQEAAANATSKAAMRRCWSQLGPYSTDFEVVRTEGEARRAVARLGSFPIIFKPDRGSGSRGVSRVEHPDDITEAFARCTALPDSDIIVEPCIQGTECAAEVLIYNGQTSVLCIGQNVKSPYPYRVNMSIEYPLPLSVDQQEVIAEMCHQAISAIGLTQGVAHIEFAYTDEGPVLFELGARCGGGHIPLIAAHVSAVDEFIEACRMACGISPKAFTPTARRGAVYQFLIFPPGKVAEIEIPEIVRNHSDILDVAVTIQEGETIPTLRDNWGRVGFAVTLTQTRESAIALANWACELITIRYEDGMVSHPISMSLCEQ